MKKYLEPIYNYDKKVHWVFECGCEYEGFYYLRYGRRQCLEHHKLLKYEYIKCRDCGAINKEKAKGRSKIFCKDCMLAKRKAETKSTKENVGTSKIICCFPGCINEVTPPNLKLCNTHYRTNL